MTPPLQGPLHVESPAQTGTRSLAGDPDKARARFLPTESITLFTPYFLAADASRQAELDACLRHNLANPLIDRIYLLIDDGAQPPEQDAKIRVVSIDHRPSYADWLSCVEQHEPPGIALLANSDIHFDDSLAHLPGLLPDLDSFLALSRWEADGGQLEKHPNPHWSQDVWALRARAAFPEPLKRRLGFPLGTPRCDNKVAYVFATAGWRVKNPHDLVISHHLQSSEGRGYDKRGDTTIIGGVAYVHPAGSDDPESRLEFDIWTLGEPRVDKVSLNRSLERWRRQDLAVPPAAVAEPENAMNGHLVHGHRKLDLFRQGRRIHHDPAEGMTVFEGADALLVQCGIDPREWIVLDKHDGRANDDGRVHSDWPSRVLAGCEPDISDAPRSSEDVCFWQYPCITELQARDNHRRPADDDDQGRPHDGVLDCYLGLPWATWIDHRSFPESVLKAQRQAIATAGALARASGCSLRVHTVCQHIRWRLMLDIALDVGVTDLWVSHCTAQAQEEIAQSGAPIRLHPWSLYAVNHCDPARSHGLTPDKPMRERKLLASFIGAHMPHYLSDIRVRIDRELNALERDDLHVRLGDVWHFNHIVYDHQVLRKQLEENHEDAQKAAALNYNQLLSDSRFSLCPAGSGPNTLRLWESIAVGSIPVRFDDGLLLPEPFAEELERLCIDWTDPETGAGLVAHLESFDLDELQSRSDRLREIYAAIETMTCY